MSTVKVVDLISRAHTILLDTTAVRWPALELQNWLNDGYREIVNILPAAYVQSTLFTCAAGYRQDISSISTRVFKLIEVICNRAASSRKRAIQLVSRKSLDTMRPGWYAETAGVNIQKYVFDPRMPKEFLVYPPATTAAQVELLYSEVPAPHTLTESQLMNSSTTEVIRLDDIYASPLLDYILYRAYTKDAEQPNNAARAVAHYQAMTTALGGRTQGDKAAEPGVA